MGKFEYELVYANGTDSPEYLNKMGKDGWRAVQMAGTKYSVFVLFEKDLTGDHPYDTLES